MLLNTETVHYEYDVVQVVYAMELGQREKITAAPCFDALNQKNKKQNKPFLSCRIE